MKQSISQLSCFAKIKSFGQGESAVGVGGGAGRPVSVINKLTNGLCQNNNKSLNNSICTDWN